MNLFEATESPNPDFEIERLKVAFDDPGQLPRLRAEEIVSRSLPGFWYINPMVAIHASEPSEVVLGLVDKFHQDWYGLSRRRQKGKSQQTRDRIDDRMLLAYSFEGVVVSANVLLPFTWWRDCWEAKLDPASVYRQRREAIDLLRDGNVAGLGQIQASEIQQVLCPDQDFDDDPIHVVLPHLTIRTPSNIFLERRVRKEVSSWKHRLRKTLGKERAAGVPVEVKCGQAIYRGFEIVLFKKSREELAHTIGQRDDSRD